MRFPFNLLRACSLMLAATSAMAQTASLAVAPKRDSDGVYEVLASNLKNLDPSAKVEFPPELSAYEVSDTVAIEVTVSPEGKVTKAKAVKGKMDVLKEAAEKTVKKWTFAPYLINGEPVPVRAEITFNFVSNLDLYRDRNGDVPVRLDQKTAQALVTTRVEPQYPPDARSAHIAGAVELRVIVGEDGRVRALHIVTGQPILATAAYNAVRQWQFKPYVENGKTVPVDTNVTVKFTIQ